MRTSRLCCCKWARRKLKRVSGRALRFSQPTTLSDGSEAAEPMPLPAPVRDWRRDVRGVPVPLPPPVDWRRGVPPPPPAEGRREVRGGVLTAAVRLP